MNKNPIVRRLSTIAAVVMLLLATGCAGVTDPNANLDTEFEGTEQIDFQFEDDLKDLVTFDEEDADNPAPPPVSFP